MKKKDIKRIIVTTILFAALLTVIYFINTPHTPQKAKQPYQAPAYGHRETAYGHRETAYKVPIPPMKPDINYPPLKYELIGYLESEDGMGTRPLLGRRSHTRQHRWYYSSTNDSQSEISTLRLPVSSTSQQRKCTEEIGCEELYDGDVVTIPGISQPLRVRLYEKHFG